MWLTKPKQPLPKVPKPTKKQLEAYFKNKNVIWHRGIGWNLVDYRLDRNQPYIPDTFEGDGAKTNLERIQRIVGLDMLRHDDPDGFLRVMKAKHLRRFKSARGNQIWETHGYNSNYGWATRDAVQWWLRYTDPSTGRVYVSGVPVVITDKGAWTADDSMAWKFNLTAAEYLGLAQEA